MDGIVATAVAAHFDTSVKITFSHGLRQRPVAENAHFLRPRTDLFDFRVPRGTPGAHEKTRFGAPLRDGLHNRARQLDQIGLGFARALPRLLKSHFHPRKRSPNEK